MIRRLSSADSGFAATLDALLHFDNSTDEAIEKTVAEILARVRREGDPAVQQHRHLPRETPPRMSVAALLGTANVPFCGKSTPRVVSWAVMRY